MRWIEPPDGRPWALLTLCGASLLLNIALIVHEIVEVEAPAADEPLAAVESVSTDPAVAPEGGDGLADAAPAGEDALAIGLDPEPALPDHLEVVHAEVTHSLARTFQNATPEHADVLSAVYARLFFWDLDLRRDLQQGDEVTVVYEWDGELAHIPVATYRSQKLGKTLRAYRFQASGDPFPSWWNEEGVEVGGHLKQSPLTAYEQVTSLIKDRPTHKGMDFKVPVGAEVSAPQRGTVVRTNWNVAFNGNCVELRYTDGTLARFLHLSETDVRPGQTVAAGQKIGLSGNTGRSTAPHLHYELERGGRVIDPVDYHGTVRRTLPDPDRAAFESEIARLDGMLSSET